MKFLVDTNVFLHAINDDIYAVACKCRDRNSMVTITKAILNELDPKFYGDHLFQETYNCVCRYSHSSINLIKVIDINDVETAKKIYKSIRERYYRWMNDTKTLMKMVNEGKLTREYIKSSAFRQKDVGECELIAIAKASLGEYIIISEDNGEVYKHPDINIFNIFRKEGVDIYKTENWLEIIQFERATQESN